MLINDIKLVVIDTMYNTLVAIQLNFNLVLGKEIKSQVYGKPDSTWKVG